MEDIIGAKQGKTFYMDCEHGLDRNDGLSVDTAVQTQERLNELIDESHELQIKEDHAHTKQAGA